MFKICIFAGTTEGRRLAELLDGRGIDISVCVATQYGGTLFNDHPGIEVHAARMNAEEMRGYLQEKGFDLVVDATHPYAWQVTDNLSLACKEAGMEYMRLTRPSEACTGDGIYVTDAESCAELLSEMQGNILLTTGSKDLPVYCRFPSLRDRLYVRVLPLEASLKICSECGIHSDHIIAMQGPFDEDLNYAMLKSCNARFLVTKDSGDVGGYGAKLAAAERSGAQIVIIGRPSSPDGMSLETVLEEIERRFPLERMQKHVVLAGIGMGNLSTRTLGLQKALEEADCVIGARRMLDAVDCTNQMKFCSIVPSEIEAFIHSCRSCQRYLVLYSGDTGFYSGAKALRESLKDCDVQILPGIGSLQYFCARLGRGWEDICCVSLHGRECDLVKKVRDHQAVFALVGGKDGARAALSRLNRAGLGHLRAWVGERLAYPEERIYEGSVEKLSHQDYDSLSVILVENLQWGLDPITQGLPDSAFSRADVPMTKSEVRSVCLSKLALGRRSVVYDVGSGSGSVTVEVARIADKGKVYAIEHNHEALALTAKNVERFELTNVEIIEGSAPEALIALEMPSHAFIGGSSGNLREIIQCLCGKNPQVRMVITAVTLDTISALVEIGKEFEIFEVVQLNVSRAQKLGRSQLMMAQNPVYIVTLQNLR